MKILTALLVIFAMSGCANFGPLRYQDNVVSFPARIIDIKQVQRSDTSPIPLVADCGPIIEPSPLAYMS